MATKRNHSSCSSESDCETKKLNLQDTPVKITEMSLMEAEPTEQEEDIDRDKAIQAVMPMLLSGLVQCLTSF